MQNVTETFICAGLDNKRKAYWAFTSILVLEMWAKKENKMAARGLECFSRKSDKAHDTLELFLLPF